MPVSPGQSYASRSSLVTPCVVAEGTSPPHGHAQDREGPRLRGPSWIGAEGSGGPEIGPRRKLRGAPQFPAERRFAADLEPRPYSQSIVVSAVQPSTPPPPSAVSLPSPPSSVSSFALPKSRSSPPPPRIVFFWLSPVSESA